MSWTRLFIEPRPGMRADIQALRAVAVLSVVFYHIWPAHLVGGFMGVDVFFVISGYLMTMTIWKGVSRLEQSADGPGGHSSFKASINFLFTFYARRIKRLAPAATALLVAVLVAIYLCGDFGLQLSTAPQVITSIAFMQNWYLAGQAVDYLGSDAGATAVQHFWSLSVEEQFYMFWPMLMLITGICAFAFHKRRGYKSPQQRNGVTDMLPLIVVTAFTVCSFVCGLYLTYANPAEAYFVTPARIWELSLGGIIVFLPPIKQRDLRLLLPWLGLVMIAYPIVQWGGAKFPGLKALVPTIGTALVIWCSVETVGKPSNGEQPDSPFSVANLSRLRVAQFFGDISYSLYLWHWPLVVLLPIFLGVDLNHGGNSARLLKLTILFAGIALAWLSYRFIETPTKLLSPKRAGTAKIWAVGVACLALVLVPGRAIETRAADYTEHIVQKAFVRATDPNDIGFGARATEHRGEIGTTKDPFGQVDPEWAQFGSSHIYGTIDSADNIADFAASITYSCDIKSKTSPDITGEFGDTKSARTILVLGDSFSKQWYPAIDIAARNLGYKVIAANSIYSNGSLFEMGDEFGNPWTYYTGQKISITRSNDRFYWIRDHLWSKADAIIVGVSSNCFTQENTNPQNLRDAPSKLASTLRDIHERTGKKAILIQAPPNINGWSGQSTNVQNLYVNKLDKISKDVKKRMDLVYDKLERAGALDEFDYLKVESMFLDDDGNAHTQIGGVPVYHDGLHINTLYSSSAGTYFTKQLAALLTAK